MTLPTLIQKHNDLVKVTKLKKFMSVMNSALTMSIQDNGPIDSWNLTNTVFDEDSGLNTDESAVGQNLLMKYILPYLKYIKFCEVGSPDCNSYDRFSLDGTKFSSFTDRVILADGSAFLGVVVTDSTCKTNVGNNRQLQNICGQLFFDTNWAQRRPNRLGDDIFLFWFTKYGVFPMGTAMETSAGYSFDNSCSISVSNRLNGYGCTAWAIYNGNLDYKYCNDLSWNGKTKCN